MIPTWTSRPNLSYTRRGPPLSPWKNEKVTKVLLKLFLSLNLLRRAVCSSRSLFLRKVDATQNYKEYNIAYVYLHLAVGIIGIWVESSLSLLASIKVSPVEVGFLSTEILDFLINYQRKPIVKPNPATMPGTLPEIKDESCLAKQTGVAPRANNECFT